MKQIGRNVAPVRERGLKYAPRRIATDCRPVAPVRERGLKCALPSPIRNDRGRSREGAWIEMPYAKLKPELVKSLP